MNSTVFSENMKKFRSAKQYTQEEVAEKLCNKVAIIKDGKIIANGTMAEVKKDKSLESAFLESANE